MKEEIQKRRQELKKEMEKKFGKGSLMGGNEKPLEQEIIPTGSLGLDNALGIGGLPKGRIVEIYGPESSGKTTLAIHVIAEAMKNENSLCTFVDVEHAFDSNYATSLGVDMERLDISQPDYGEQALEIADSAICSGLYDVVVVDSVAALVTKKELEGEMGDSVMGSQARLMSQALRKLTASVAKNNTILIFINQLRDKIGVMFGSPETTTGGNALKFYASVRLDVRRSLTTENTVMGENKEKLGNKVTVKVIKNKLAPPFKKAEFNILYGIGIDKFSETVEYAVETGTIAKSGNTYSYEGAKLAVGMAKLNEFLKDNMDLFEEIKEKTFKNLKEYDGERVDAEPIPAESSED